jgi:hypothetical protein
MLCCFADGLYHENWDVMTPEPTVRAVPRNRELEFCPVGGPWACPESKIWAASVLAPSSCSS